MLKSGELRAHNLLATRERVECFEGFEHTLVKSLMRTLGRKSELIGLSSQGS